LIIDLHLHTTASDGRCSPRELVDRAAAAGVDVMGVTDHDTTAAIDETTDAARSRGIEVVPGIEVTAVEDGRDVHVLGYFVDDKNAELERFLSRQRAQRVARVQAIAQRLAELGMPIDMTPLLRRADEAAGRSVGRPLIARQMIAARYVADTREAFDRWLATGRPAFVPRAGAPAEDVIAIIHAAGGLASLAHPAQTRVDARIADYVAAGLDAVEVFHPDHDEAARTRYQSLALDLKLLATGGSDFHGDSSHGWEPGAVTLPRGEWLRLRAAAHA
jgi:predicted metal-dependent phosphoesterase TrpH